MEKSTKLSNISRKKSNKGFCLKRIKEICYPITTLMMRIIKNAMIPSGVYTSVLKNRMTM